MPRTPSNDDDSDGSGGLGLDFSAGPLRPGEGRGIYMPGRRPGEPSSWITVEREGTISLFEPGTGRRNWSYVIRRRRPPLIQGRLPVEHTDLPDSDPQMQAYAHVLERTINDAPAAGQAENLAESAVIWVVTEAGGPNGEDSFTLGRLGDLQLRGRGRLTACRDESQRGRFYWWISLSDQ